MSRTLGTPQVLSECGLEECHPSYAKGLCTLSSACPCSKSRGKVPWPSLLRALYAAQQALSSTLQPTSHSYCPRCPAPRDWGPHRMLRSPQPLSRHLSLREAPVRTQEGRGRQDSRKGRESQESILEHKLPDLDSTEKGQEESWAKPRKAQDQ